MLVAHLLVDDPVRIDDEHIVLVIHGLRLSIVGLRLLIVALAFLVSSHHADDIMVLLVVVDVPTLVE